MTERKRKRKASENPLDVDLPDSCDIPFPTFDKESSDDDGEKDDDDDSDGNDYDDGMEYDDDTEVIQNNTTPTKKVKVRKQNPYRPPTNKEMYQLRETEDLFQASLFKMQVTEMLSEITLKETRRKFLESALAQLKDIIQQFPKGTQHELDDCSWIKTVRIPLFNTGRPICGKFKFVPPSEFSVVGSYKLKSCIKPDIHVDVMLEMPKACFQKQDYLNHKYFKKRALYLVCIARKLKKHPDFIEDMKFLYHQGNHLKPVLVLFVKGPSKKPVKIHVHVKPEDEVFKLNRFAIYKNNVRKRWFEGHVEGEAESADGENLVPTPFYNSTALQDVTVKNNNKFLYNLVSDNPTVLQAISLLKVWLHQRELYKGFGGFSGYIMSMYVAYLLWKKKLSVMMSSQQILRTTLHNLSQANWIEDGITLCKGTTEDKHRPTVSDFHQKFSVVFVDVTGYLNLCYCMTKSVFLRVKHEAKLAVQILENKLVESFEVLFMTSVPFQRKFDQIIHIPVKSLENSVGRFGVEEKYLDMGGHYVYSTVPNVLDLLSSSLGDRLHLLQCQVDASPQWSINEEPPGYDCHENIAIGLLLNHENCSSVLDRGPPADSHEAKSFRKFWGEKSELRRFKDGSICEAVVWDEAKTMAKRRFVCYYIIKHVLERHAGINSDDITSATDQLDGLLSLPLSKMNRSLLYGTGEEQNFAVIKAFDDLSRILRSSADFPLAINTIQGNCPVFRFTEVFPPMATLCNPNSQQIEMERVSLPVSNAACPVWTPALKVMCMLEGSGSWPEDREAIRRLKAAFNIKVAECLEKHLLIAEVRPEYVDVVKDGLVFRLIICYAREIAVLKMVKTPNGLLKMLDTEESMNLENEIKVLPKLTSTLFGIQQTHNTFSCVARLAKRWVSGHMLLDYIEEEAIELIIAYLYLHPEPFTPPGSPIVGFVRFLQFLSTFDWKSLPLIVNLNNEFSYEDIVDIKAKFSKEREKLPQMFISIPQDRYSSYMTQKKPSAQILLRLVLLARESLKILQQQLASISANPDFKVIFRPQLDIYDVLIHLKFSQLNKHHLSIDASDHSYRPTYVDGDDSHRPKSAADDQSSDKSFPVTDYEPAQYYLKELRETYNDMAIFFFDKFGGSVIAVLWKPLAFISQKFQVSSVNSKMPKIESTEKGKDIVHMVPNVEAIIEDFKILGGGLVLKVEAKTEKWKF